MATNLSLNLFPYRRRWYIVACIHTAQNDFFFRLRISSQDRETAQIWVSRLRDQGITSAYILESNEWIPISSAMATQWHDRLHTNEHGIVYEAWIGEMRRQARRENQVFVIDHHRSRPIREEE